MSHAAITLTQELAYLRNLYDEAVRAGKSVIANSVACDIADLVGALEVIERNRQLREQGLAAA
jgi:hypothetical protein